MGATCTVKPGALGCNGEQGRVMPIEGGDFEHDVLDVYASHDGGWWHPEHGEVEIPDGWALLPSGDPYHTRTVGQLGDHWIAWQPGDRRRGRRRRRIGTWAPEGNIELAELRGAETADRRAKARERASDQRDRAEVAYRDQLAAAIMAWLDFVPAHADLARDIADRAADRAAAVGSGRVGRTSTLTIDDKAALAARAHIRHHHTNYEDLLAQAQLELGNADLDTATYRAIRHDAHDQVDRFLEVHRGAQA